jgi:hypothetical protein
MSTSFLFRRTSAVTFWQLEKFTFHFTYCIFSSSFGWKHQTTEKFPRQPFSYRKPNRWPHLSNGASTYAPYKIHCFIWQLASLFTQPFSHDNNELSVASILICRESGSVSLLYKCNGVNIKFLKKVLEIIAFGPQTFVTSKELRSLLYTKIL